MTRTRPTAVALLLGFSIFSIAGAPQAGHHSVDGPTHEVAIFSDDDAQERIVVIRRDRHRATGVEGMAGRARLLQGKQVERAAKRIARLADDEGVSLVDIDAEGGSQVMILADDNDDGGSAYINIGEHGIEIHADGDDGDAIHMSFGNPDRNAHARRDGAVRIHARNHHDGERAVVLLKNLDAEATRDLIDDLDDVPRALKREMLRELDL